MPRPTLLERFTDGRWQWVWCALPALASLGFLFLYRGVGRYNPPDFGGPEPFENHRGAIEILARGNTDMTFHATGYAYLVALVYLFTPNLPISMLFVQAAMLPLVVWAISQVALRFGGELPRRVALVVGGLYYPFAYYAATFSSIVVASLLTPVMVWLSIPLLERTAWRRSLAVGLLLGVIVCSRPNLGFFGVVIAVSVLIASRSLVQTAIRCAPVAAVSLGMLTAMSLANPPEPGQFVRGSQGMNRSLLDSTYQFESRWFDWEKVGDSQANARANEHWARLEAESGKPMIAPETQLLARRDAIQRMKDDPLGVLKKAAISAVRIWVFMPSHSDSAPLKVGVVILELVLLAFAIVGIRVSRKAKRPWYLGAGIMLIPTLSHLVMHVEPRYSLPARGMEVAFIAVGLAAVFRWREPHEGLK